MITVLRLGHRIKRDIRISTHVALVARAFGANRISYTGQKDSSFESSINKVVKQWGGKFSIKHVDLDNFLEKNKARIIHLTVYGIPMAKKIKEIRKIKNLVVIVGGEKVPWHIFEKSDYNLSITNQPHSEVSSLGIFLHEYFKGKELKFVNAKRKVIPKEKGKKIIVTKDFKQYIKTEN